jgi:hypothetical protein
MIGVYDFCGHYEWTFAWLHAQGGEALVRKYWDEAINSDSQRHAAELIVQKGFSGMAEYWGHTLAQERAGYHTTLRERLFRIDMHDCPSKGFLIRNKLEQYHDYCDHCIGWIGPMLKQSGFVIDHEHNHCGQCWWEIRHASDSSKPSESGSVSGSHDVRRRPDWSLPERNLDVYRRANDPGEKQGAND